MLIFYSASLTSRKRISRALMQKINPGVFIYGKLFSFFKADRQPVKKQKRKYVFYIYILKCSDGTFYTGYTHSLDHRVIQHNEGKGAKYTRGRLPVTLVYFEKYETKSEAMKREYQIKQLSREEKMKLVYEG